MSHWNYRLAVQSVDGLSIWEVREMYYEDSGEVFAWSSDPVAASGESARELLADLDHMVELGYLTEMEEE